METHPQVIIVGGPNDSGKSTMARNVVPAFGVEEFVNADVIARGLSAAHPERAAFQAGRIMLARLEELAALRRDFAFETTLSARTYAATIEKLCDDGWVFRLIFVTLRNAALAVERVKNRVGVGTLFQSRTFAADSLSSPSKFSRTLYAVGKHLDRIRQLAGEWRNPDCLR